MRVFSGIRPSGKLHIGNYLGSIKQWVKFQEKSFECFFCIVDYHAITTPFEPEKLKKNIFETLAAYLAAGIDPEKATIFVQSQVKEHTELAWILGTITPFGQLKGMTQFKEKSRQYKDYVNCGLFNYPLLMASDILLYKTDLVPVGKDQVQHLELTREIARRFNKMFGKTFKVPKISLSEAEKIMSLKNPRKKMSKTDDPKGCVFLFDEPKDIKKKIMTAITDSGKLIKYDPKKKPGISNLILIYSSFSGKEIKEVEKEFKGKGYAFFKRKLAKLLIDSLEIFRKKKESLSKREVYLREILKEGRKKAEKIAKETMGEVKRKMGFLN
jgi:tryptophanyl-tRNA synthetase